MPCDRLPYRVATPSLLVAFLSSSWIRSTRCRCSDCNTFTVFSGTSPFLFLRCAAAEQCKNFIMLVALVLPSLGTLPSPVFAR